MNLYSLKEILKKILPKNFLTAYHFILAFCGALFYRFPSRKIKVIGVTGTNGKTTVTEMIAKILEEGGYKVALMNSVRFKIGDQTKDNLLKMTMPGRFVIQKFLRKAVRAGCQYFILEVTSEGIKQHRHRFINFEAAIFTNLSPEHIESHGGFEKYRQAKGKLFKITKNIHIINNDDPHAQYFLQFRAKTKYLYQMLNKNQESKITVVNSKSEVLKEIKIPEIKLNLWGDFNIYNALAGISFGLSQGINLETSKKTLENFMGVPGRMELVIDQPFKVFVDYAFTPNALQKVYETLSVSSKFQNSKSKMICVLGACGGGRDKWKRPVLGEIAARYCSEIIITNEDPYDEDPYQILSMIKSGILKSQFPISNFYEILDRREAIKKSLELARPGDIVIITGKGSEPWMCLAKGKKIPWDDRKIVKEEIEKI